MHPGTSQDSSVSAMEHLDMDDSDVDDFEDNLEIIDV